MKSLSAILAGLAGVIPPQSLQPADAMDVDAEKGAHAAPVPGRRHRMHDYQSLTDLPHDGAIPALGAIATSGIRGALPFLDLPSGTIDVTMRGYTEGKRMTLEVRAGDRRAAVKCYNMPPDLEAKLYATIAGSSGAVRVPRLIGWDPDLRVMALEWLEGPNLLTLLKNGQGRRVGELAAAWLLESGKIPVRFGDHLGAESMLAKSYKWTDRLGAADPSLGSAAAIVAKRLVATQPVESATRLVHGSLYDRHILDAGDGPALIDWDCFGQGPAELDAAVFLSVIWRGGLKPDRHEAATQARAVFLECTAGLLNETALAWHQAVTMLRLAHKKIRREDGDAVAAARPLLLEAARLAAAAG
ncbi:MAG TPA: phosphotransferase [Gemmatimonadales bacterium]|jgi:hypothetical protein